VIDTGIGIAPQKLGLIFESFRQLDSGLSRLYRGLGLGLTLAKAIVEAMGGNISVQSSEGEGSTFALLVPFPAAAPPEVRPAPSLRAPSAKILLVDDNRIAQAVVAHALRKGNYRADFADDGEHGLEMARESAYDLILMDLQMPGMDGFETARRIRELPGYARVPIVALTANYSDEQRATAQQFGMQGYVGKPVRREELLAAVEKYLARINQ
jgi:CheY-like chemotaxis protein